MRVKSTQSQSTMSSENIVGLLYDMCRLCLERIGLHNVISSVDTLRDIAECAGVQVEPGDELPETICEVCAERLHMCRAFRRLAARSDERLRLLRAQGQARRGKMSISDMDLETIIPEIVMGATDTSQDEETTPAKVSAKDLEKQKKGKAVEPARKSSKKAIKKKSKDLPQDLETIVPEIVMGATDTSRDEGTTPARVSAEDLESQNKNKAVEPVRTPSKKTIKKKSIDLSQPEEPIKKGKLKRKNGEISRKDANKNDSTSSESNDGSSPRMKRKRTAVSSVIDYIKRGDGLQAAKKDKFKKPVTIADELTCETCFKQCTTPKALYLHRRSHNRNYPCDLCEKAFSSNGDLTKHVRTHTGERPYTCAICGKGFAQNVSLKQHHNVHIKTESNEPPKRGRRPKVNVSASMEAGENVISETSGEDVPHPYEISNSDNISVIIVDPNTTLDNCDSVPVKLKVEEHEICLTKTTSAIESDPCANQNVADMNGGHCLDSKICVVSDLDAVESIFFHDNSTKTDNRETLNSKKPHVCDICNKRFALEEKLRRHKDKHENAKNLTCVTDDKSSLNTPINKEVDENLLNLNGVGSPTNKGNCSDNGNEAIDDPSTEIGNDETPKGNRTKPHACDICNKRFARKEKLHRHRDQHENATIRACVPDEKSSNAESITVKTNGDIDLSDNQIVNTPINEEVDANLLKMNGVGSPTNTGSWSDDNEDDTIDDLPTEIDPLENEISQILNETLFRCGVCQKTYTEEVKFEIHKKRHQKKLEAPSSVRRFC